MKIAAPIDGVISEVNAGPGDLVVRGSPIARLTSLDRFVEAEISEENFAGVRIGQPATVRFLQYGGMLYNARVVKILPEADPQTQRFKVHLDVEIEPEKLIPGITGEVSIVLDERPNALVIPRSALFGEKVFVVENNRVQVRDVQLGYTGLNLVEVLSGLEEGELVIVDEVDRFREGDRVRVVRTDELEDATAGES
ncbi:MAG: efflux RND transporter periplasmic adaptor subunit [Verrucomicrobia bacterium]|nr:MAG: efflux RND transporter periplasmic adaptor subunit [Verrucomicrobiota bacterium]